MGEWKSINGGLGMEYGKKNIKQNLDMLGYKVVKKFFDVLISIIAIIFSIPIYLIIFIIFKIGDNSGPMFYRQVRIGKHGKQFKIIKIRSMVVNAEKKLYENKELYAKYVANSYKLEADEDPRITRVGAFLRKTSLDELPQFINVLIGDMSLIGPRPIIESELEEYGNDVDEFLSVIPGIFGYWQGMGRSNINYPRRAKIELYYVRNASLFFDIKILGKNIINVIKSEGAH